MNAFHLEPRNKYFEAIRSAADFELRPGPSVSFLGEVDLTSIELLRERMQTGVEGKPSYTACVAKAVALALREFPYANRRVCRSPWSLWLRTRLQTFNCVDIAFGIERNIKDSESVAFMDVIRNVDQLPLGELNKSLRSLSESDG